MDGSGFYLHQKATAGTAFQYTRLDNVVCGHKKELCEYIPILKTCVYVLTTLTCLIEEHAR